MINMEQFKAAITEKISRLALGMTAEQNIPELHKDYIISGWQWIDAIWTDSKHIFCSHCTITCNCHRKVLLRHRRAHPQLYLQTGQPLQSFKQNNLSFKSNPRRWRQMNPSPVSLLCDIQLCGGQRGEDFSISSTLRAVAMRVWSFGRVTQAGKVKGQRPSCLFHSVYIDNMMEQI